MHKYDKKLNGTWQFCQVHGGLPSQQMVQHHVYHRGYEDWCIWVCARCHSRIHHDTIWAYENGYLIRHNASYNIKMKEASTKKCTHSKSYYSAKFDRIVCQYCGQPVDTINFGAKKGKEQNVNTNKQPKMGYGAKDPRVQKLEQLKGELATVTWKIKQSADDKDKYEALKKRKAEIKAELLKLQASYEDSD